MGENSGHFTACPPTPVATTQPPCASAGLSSWGSLRVEGRRDADVSGHHTSRLRNRAPREGASRGPCRRAQAHAGPQGRNEWARGGLQLLQAQTQSRGARGETAGSPSMEEGVRGTLAAPVCMEGGDPISTTACSGDREGASSPGVWPRRSPASGREHGENQTAGDGGAPKAPNPAPPLRPQRSKLQKSPEGAGAPHIKAYPSAWSGNDLDSELGGVRSSSAWGAGLQRRGSETGGT